MDFRSYSAGLDVLAGETGDPVALSGQFAIASAIQAELELVFVVAVAVELEDQPAVDKQVYFSNAMDVYPVFEGNAGLV